MSTVSLTSTRSLLRQQSQSTSFIQIPIIIHPRKRRCIQHVRPFSSTSADFRRSSGAQVRMMMQRLDHESEEEKAAKLSRDKLPTDVGKFPDMLIVDGTSKLPSYFGKEYRKRFRLLGKLIFQRAQGLVAPYAMNRWQAVYRDPITRKRQPRPLELSSRYLVARKLHTALYTAIAKGDLSTLEKITCDGLYRKCLTLFDLQSARRELKKDFTCQYLGFTPPTSKYLPWPIQALTPNKSTAIVVDKMGEIPFPGTGPRPVGRQVVVRLRSKQKTVETDTRVDGRKTHEVTGVTRPRQVVEKEITEYLVIQRMDYPDMDREEIQAKNEEEGIDGWRVWGTIEATGEKELEEILAKKQDLTWWERVRSMAGATSPGAMGAGL